MRARPFDSLRVGSCCLILAVIAGCGGSGSTPKDSGTDTASTGSGGRGTGGSNPAGSGGSTTASGGAIGSGGDGAGGAAGGSTGSGGAAGGSTGSGGAAGANTGGRGGTAGANSGGRGGNAGANTGGRGGNAGANTGGSAGGGGRGGAGGNGGAGVSCQTAATCSAPAGGNGVATCTNNICGITCNSGYHRCGDACLVNNSPNSCGNLCTACPAPAAGGVATCDGTGPYTCGVNCTTGYHECGTGANATCVVNGSTAVTSCGNSCTVCPDPANGSPTCSSAGVCGVMCDTGYHACGSSCVANNSTSVSACGMSCTACTDPPNGSPTCAAPSAGATPVCGLACNTGFHACPATNPTTCSSNTSPDACGASCTVCPTRANATRTCTAGVCGFECDDGYHVCNGQCVSNSAVATCGTVDNVSCSPCQGGTAATCSSAGVCGTSCGTGMHMCTALVGCFADNDVDHCGPATCATCPMPSIANAQRVCTSNTCAIACQANYHRCPATGPTFTCVPNDDPDTCGTSCTACPGPASNGDATCSVPPGGTALACGYNCDQPGYCKRGTASAPTCVANTTADACGAACTTCPTTGLPTGSTGAACVDGACSFTCDATMGLHRCGNACVDNDHCGPACAECPGAQVCNSTNTACVAP